MTQLLILKTAALGDVLRTTSILPGLAEAHPDLDVTWVTAPGAVPLVESHPLVQTVLTVDPGDDAAVDALATRLGLSRWDRVLSFDDEAPMCRLASALATERLSGAHLDERGRPTYTLDVAAWFDMGLLSVHGREAADRLKVENTRSHPAIFASMLGITMGKPRWPLPAAELEFARRFAERTGLDRTPGPLIGLNTGAGGRWRTKELSAERTIELGRLLAREHVQVRFLVLGGQLEAERNARILAGLAGLGDGVRVIDGGTDNSLGEFAALVARCDLLVTSDSLALHVGISQDVRILAFFAPTSAAEIELYGLGEKVWSTAPDYCSYRTDADNSSVTPERLAAAASAVLGAGGRAADRLSKG